MPKPTDRWVPERAGSAVIFCVRSGGSTNPSQLIDWETPEDAAEADLLLYGEPCGTGCVMNHLRAWTEPGKLHVVRSIHEPPPPSRSAAILRAYPPCFQERHHHVRRR